MSVLSLIVQLLPLVLIQGYTIGYGLFMRKAGEKGLAATLFLAFLNVAALLILFRERM